jgi:hypothetical protein
MRRKATAGCNGFPFVRFAVCSRFSDEIVAGVEKSRCQPTLEGKMYWRVTYGAKEVFKHGAPRQAPWRTLKGALEFARQQLQEGDRVTQITGPSGEVLDQTRILELVHLLDSE